MPRRVVVLSRFLALGLVLALLAVGLPASMPILGGSGDEAAAGEADEPVVRVREVTERRTPSMRLFELSDGRLEAEVFAQPQHFRADDGTWRPIDTTVREQDGDGYVLGNDTNGFGSALAKAVDLVSVRVLSCENLGSTSQIIAGVEWVTEHAERPAVVNMSLGGSESVAEELAVKNSIASGLTYVVSAGNDSRDACTYSPGRAAGGDHGGGKQPGRRARQELGGTRPPRPSSGRSTGPASTCSRRGSPSSRHTMRPTPPRSYCAALRWPPHT